MLNQFLSGKKTFSLFLLIIRLLYCSDTKQNARNFTIARTLQYFLQKFSKIEIRVYSFAKISLHRFVILTAIPRRASIVRARNTRAHTHNESVFFHFRSMERNRSISNSSQLAGRLDKVAVDRCCIANPIGRIDDLRRLVFRQSRSRVDRSLHLANEKGLETARTVVPLQSLAIPIPQLEAVFFLTVLVSVTKRIVDSCFLDNLSSIDP